jgi:hypothetical protein
MNVKDPVAYRTTLFPGTSRSVETGENRIEGCLLD